ncbi:MAG TPA: GNAT family N-acetyltransferase, partial [Polyangiales bacterium]|jgi:hypothetical protein|nr:GNAT family N-acetyltransferase [Polyangiales bacterium]
MHLVMFRGAQPIGALPLYAKQHSYGEYVFDFGWANAAERAGIEYYPKLVAMVPLTPATGRRVLYLPGEDPELVTRVLLDGVVQACAQMRASSAHLLFLSSEEHERITRDPRFMSRSSLQFHWHNTGVTTFEEHLATFRSVARKEIRKERRRVAESGLAISVVPGSELGDEEWNALTTFYFDTCDKHGSGPYLTREFFPIIARTHAARVVAVLARRDGRIIAGALNFEKGKHLYGRYWGTLEEHAFLHFEVCYHQLIERAIKRGYTRFEAGAQGMHKLRRGLLPSEIHSACYVADPRLARAVGDFLRREKFGVQEELRALREHGPSRRDG